MSAPGATSSWSERKREFAFGPADHRAIARLAYEETGIMLPESKAQLVYGRLAPLARARGLTDIAGYIAVIRVDPTERARAIDALTTKHTHFFRESHHFDDFVARVWPDLAARLANSGRVRLWSAACATGEEPYSWLMALLGSGRDTAVRTLRSDFRMLASDISASALTTGRAGRYGKDTLGSIPAKLRMVWLGGSGPTRTIDPLLRRAVAFRTLNLLGDWPMRGRFDAISCRNVMIYFDDAAKARLQARLADRLELGGTLYIGHSERLIGDVQRQFRSLGNTAYQKVTA